MTNALSRRNFLAGTAAVARAAMVPQLVQWSWAQWPGPLSHPPKSSSAPIAPASEPGEPLVIFGKVFEADARTPATGVILYAYHTDANGLYRLDHYIPDWQTRRPRLEADVKSAADGSYEFRTIRPAPYPQRNNPAHVHFVLWWPDHHRQSDILWFHGDPLLTAQQYRQNFAKGNFSRIQPVAHEGISQHVRLDFRRHEEEEQ